MKLAVELNLATKQNFHCQEPPNQNLNILWKQSFFQIRINLYDVILWRKVWDKHESCTTFIQYNYFNLTINLQFNYNVTLMLEAENIIPGANCIAQKIIQIIKNKKKDL